MLWAEKNDNLRKTFQVLSNFLKLASRVMREIMQFFNKQAKRRGKPKMKVFCNFPNKFVCHVGYGGSTKKEI
jgi:hypothetical protein